MNRLRSYLPAAYIKYFENWCKSYRACKVDTAALTMRMPGMKRFIDDLIVSAIFAANNTLSAILTTRILKEAGLLFNIADNSLILKKYCLKTSNIESYDYQYRYSKKYACKRCACPCEPMEIQVRRGDEEADFFLFCDNCGLQQRSH